jgi:hypothetical protein
VPVPGRLFNRFHFSIPNFRPTRHPSPRPEPQNSLNALWFGTAIQIRRCGIWIAPIGSRISPRVLDWFGNRSAAPIRTSAGSPVCQNYAAGTSFPQIPTASMVCNRSSRMRASSAPVRAALVSHEAGPSSSIGAIVSRSMTACKSPARSALTLISQTPSVYGAV